MACRGGRLCAGEGDSEKPVKKKITRVKAHHFYEEVYGVNIYVINGVSPERLTEFVQREFKDPNYSDLTEFTGRCVRHPDKGTVVAMRRKFSGHCDEVGLLAHECFHAVEYILSPRGFTHGEATSEAFAYLLGSLTRRCFGILKAGNNH